MKELESTGLIWNDDTVYALGLQRLVGRILGVWPLKCHDFGSNVRFIVIITLQCILDYDLVQEFLRDCGSTFNAVDSIGIVGTASVSVVKIVVIRIHSENMFSVVNSAVRDWSIFRDEKSRRVMLNHARRGRFVLLLQLCGATASLATSFIGSPLTSEKYPNDSFDPNNITNPRMMPVTSGCSISHVSMSRYRVLYLFQGVQAVCLCFCTIACDSLFFGFAMHLCAQLEILKIDIARLGQCFEKRNVRKEFVALVERHNRLNGLVGLIEATFHLTILAQLAATTVHLSLYGVVIVFGLRDGNSTVMAISSLAVLQLLFQIYLYSYVGEYLSSQIMEIRDAAYNCTWYDWSTSLTRDVMFIMVQSHKPFYLTAGKMYRMNIESFTSFVKCIASFYSVLKLIIIG